MAIIHTSYVYHPGARLDYAYKIYQESDNILCAEGNTTQLFIDERGMFITDIPDFYRKWQNTFLINRELEK